jgi:spoIIIJ-associated protein
MEGVEAEGRTVNEATENALEQLGLSRQDVEVEVLSEGRPRLLGFRGEPARVRVTPISRPEPASVGRIAEREEDAGEDDEEDYDDDLEDEEDYDDDDDEYEEEEEEDEEEEVELPAQIRRTPAAPLPQAIPVDAADVQVAVTVLENLLQFMGVEAGVESRTPETAGDGIGMIEAVLDVEGEDLGILIGRRGQTLASLHRR